MSHRKQYTKYICLIFITLIFCISIIATGGDGTSSNPGNNSDPEIEEDIEEDEEESRDDDATYTIGGTVSGLSGNLVLKNNNGDDLSISANGSFAFSTQMPHSRSYNISIFSQPSGQICSITNGSGTINSVNVSNIQITCADEAEADTIIKPLYSTNGSNWNDYIKNDGNNNFTAQDIPCNGTETGGYNKCLNGGIFKTITVAGKSSCSQITADDDIGAFNWECDDSTNPVRIISTGFNPGMKLAHLIDFDNDTWKTNQLTVYENSTEIIETESSTWWDNPIQELTAGGSLSEASKIYIIKNNLTADFTIDADKIALVVRPDYTLSSTTGEAGDKLISASNKKFLWMEGDINANNRYTGISMEQVVFSVFHHLRIANTGYNGIYLFNASNNNFFNYVVSVNNFYNGIILAGSIYNLFQNILVSNNMTQGRTDGHGIRLINASNNNTFINTTASNNHVGVTLNSISSGSSEQTNNNVFLNTTASNSAARGISLGYHNEVFNNTFLNATSVNNNLGVFIYKTSYNTFANLVSADTFALDGIMFHSSSSNNYFTGLLKVGNNDDKDCDTGSAVLPGLDDSTCASNGSSDAQLTQGITLANSFGGKVTSDDSMNSNDTDGFAEYNNISDWLTFENDFRNWGKDGSQFFPSNSNSGDCSSDDSHNECRIWDWRIPSSDNIIRDVLNVPDGDDTLKHIWDASDENTCNKIPGATWESACTAPGYSDEASCPIGLWAPGCSSTFLRNAVEILGDGMGNNNGLCESNETCLYTPNIGSYQGDGAFTTQVFTDGALTGITLIQYANNGY